MADLITLPGSIPGLLRRGSPVIGSGKFAGRRGVIVDASLGGSHVVVAFEATATADASGEWLPRAELDLDLTDATGRAHAAWWLLDRPDPRHRSLLVEPRHADPGYLRQTCLHVAGVPA